MIYELGTWPTNLPIFTRLFYWKKNRGWIFLILYTFHDSICGQKNPMDSVNIIGSRMDHSLDCGDRYAAGGGWKVYCPRWIGTWVSSEFIRQQKAHCDLVVLQRHWTGIHDAGLQSNDTHHGEDLIEIINSLSKYFQRMNCPVTSCIVTTNRSFLSSIDDFDAVVFSHKKIQRRIGRLPNKRSWKQNYILLMEKPSEDNCLTVEFRNFFNMTMSYR